MTWLPPHQCKTTPSKYLYCNIISYWLISYNIILVVSQYINIQCDYVCLWCLINYPTMQLVCFAMSMSCSVIEKTHCLGFYLDSSLSFVHVLTVLSRLLCKEYHLNHLFLLLHVVVSISEAWTPKFSARRCLNRPQKDVKWHIATWQSNEVDGSGGGSSDSSWWSRLPLHRHELAGSLETPFFVLLQYYILVGKSW